MTQARFQHNGAAVSTTLSAAIGSADTALSLVASTSWPDGSVGPFFITVDRGLASEEKIKILSRTGLTLTVVTTPSTGRGADGTTATAHALGATVEHTLTALELDDDNDHIYTTTRDDHCFSEDTELLTEHGWLGIDAMEPGMRAWTFDLDTERADLDTIRAVWRYGREDFPELVSLRTQDLGEVLVTPGHTMVWRRANNARQSRWACRNADTMPKLFSLPARALGHSERVDFSDDQIRLLGWATTEGYIGDGYVTIAQKDGPLADRLRGILDRLGYPYGEYKQAARGGGLAANAVDGQMLSFRLRSAFLAWAMDEDKVPRQEFAKMSPRQAQIFVAEAVLGDGSVSGGEKLARIDRWLAGGPQPSMALCAKSQRFIDFVQTLCVLNGMKSRNYVDADGFNRLAIKSSREHTFALGRVSTAVVETVSNERGRVWCVTVPLHHTVIARRPGTAPFIAGNTQYINVARHDITTRHVFGGAFATPTAPPAVATAASAGAAAGPARSDHTHNVGTGAINLENMITSQLLNVGTSVVSSATTPGVLKPGGAVGVSTAAARADHQHGVDATITDNGTLTSALGVLLVKSGGIGAVQMASGVMPVLNIANALARPASPVAGQECFQVDINSMIQWTGTAWVIVWTNVGNFVPHTATVRFVPTGLGNSGDTTTYKDFFPVAIGGPVQVTGFVKQRADTTVIVSAGGSGYPVNAAGHEHMFGVNDGTADHDIERWFSNESVTSPEHQYHAGTIGITGLAAGTYTFKLRIKSDAAAGVTAWQVDGNDSWTITCTETL